MATDELKRQSVRQAGENQFSHTAPKPETGESSIQAAPRPTIGSSLRTRLLASLLGLVTISVLAVGYLGVNSVQSVGESAQQISGEALRAQAEEYLNQLTVGEAQRNDLILKRVQRDAENIARYTVDIFDNPDAFTGGDYWKAETRMFTGPDGQYMNHETDVSDVFVPNLVEVDAELQTILEMSAYLDFILVPTYDSDPNTVAIYLGTERDALRYYPNIHIGTIVPPDFQVTQRPWYINATPENNPERKVVWSSVYTDATGKGMMVTAAAPIYTGQGEFAQGEFAGVIGIDATLQDISANVENARLLGEGYSFLVDSTGHAIALPERGYQDILGRPAEPDEFGVDLNGVMTPFASVLAQMMSGATGFDTLQVGEKALFVAYAPLESVEWSMANVVEVDQVLQAMATLREELETETQSLVLARILPVGGGILALVAALGLLLTRRLINPIRSLAAAAQQIGAGQWDTSLPRAGNDEIGVLSQAFATMTVQLRELMAGLEQRVVERTRGLQAAADVARATTSLLDPDTLLRQVVDLVRERFDLYYVGLFLLDQEPRDSGRADSGRTFAVLRAGTGEAGQKMLAQGHKLEMGGESMIGQCVARSEARIALDVVSIRNEEAVRFDNPLLPETHSELALPLRSRGQVIGAMTVQSVKASAFDEAYVAVLQTMADQVAVVIDNARLFANAQASLDEMETIHQRYLGQAWAKYTSARATTGYEQIGAEMAPLGHDTLPQVQLAMTEQRPMVWRDNENDKGPVKEPSPSTLIVPIVLRGQSIGALGFKETKGKRPWSADDVIMVETIAEQLALATDNLRLLDETQRRAEAMRHLYDLSSTLMGVESSRQAMALIANTARQLTHAAVATAYVYDEARGGYERVSAAADADQWDQDVEGELTSPRPGGLTAYIIQEGAAVSIADTATDERVHPDLAAMGLQSMLGVPIQVPGQKPIGVLFCHGNPVGQFDDEDLRLVTILANRTAASLQRIRLAEEVRTALEETTALYHASRAIGAATSVEKVGQAIIDYAATSGVDAARVLLFEHDDASGDGGRNPTYVVMREEWTVDDRPAQPYGSRLPLADYPLTDLMTPHEPIIVEDILTDPRANEAARTLVAAISGLRSMIMVPITVGERWIGMLFAGRNEPFTFPEEFVRGYETLIRQAAVALESIRLLKETQQRAEQERLIGDVTARIRVPMDIETILQTAVRELGQAMEVDRVSVYLAPEEEAA